MRDLRDTDLPVEANQLGRTLLGRVRRRNHRNYRIRTLLYAGKPNGNLLNTLRHLWNRKDLLSRKASSSL